MRSNVVVSAILVICIIAGIAVRGKVITEKVRQSPLLKPKVNITPHLDLFSVFSQDHSWTATLSAQKKMVLIAPGDIIPARSVNTQTLRKGNFTWPFEYVADILKSGDITFINLETPLLKDCPSTDEGMVFCGNAQHVEGLLSAGVDVVSLANNHAGNHGEEGVAETVELLRQKGIASIGANNNPFIIEKNGKRYAFLGYNDITAPQPGVSNVELEKIKKDIASARKKADIVIVTYHWGVEYRAQPDDRQKELGHFTIDSGADLVIGNHPHWIQPIEFYRGKLITYAHGNLVFDQMWSEETREGVIGRYTFYDGKLVDIEYLPIKIYNYGQPRPLMGNDKIKILESMKKESEILATASAH